MFSSLISKLFNDLPSNFGYTIGEKVKGDDYSIWTHYRGYRKNKPEQTCSVFFFDKNRSSGNENVLGFIPIETAKKLAKNQFQRCKSLIHPCILKVYDTLEVSNSYYIITEPCVSLYNLSLSINHTFVTYTDDSKESEYEIGFPKDCISGLYEIIKGLKFLHNDGKLLHGNISPLTVYVNFDGSWKLGGFENTILMSDTSSYYMDEISKQSTAYNIMGWKFAKVSRNPKSLDLWNLGCLIYWSYQVSSNLNPSEIYIEITDQSKISQRKKIVESLKLPYMNGDVLTMENDLIPRWLYDWLSDLLTCMNTNKEISIENGLALINNNSPFVELMNQLNDFMLKSSEDKQIFCTQYLPHLLTSIKVHGDSSTNIIVIQRILEKLLLNFSQCTPSIFPLVLTLLEPYKEIRTCPKFILKSFYTVTKFLLCQNDRSIRYTLLKNISKYERFLLKDIFQSCIDSILIGFQDTTNVIRETTLQSMIVIIPLLLKEDTEKSLSNEDEIQISKSNNSKSNASSDFMCSIKEGWKKNSAAFLNAFGGNSGSQIAVDKLVCAMFSLSKDPEVIIRSNTVICFAKLMGVLPEQYHSTILNKVYLSVIKDPFPICRRAVIQALLSTIQFYSPTVITQQILPVVSVNGFIEGQPEIMEISLTFVKNAINILSPYIEEQVKLKQEQDRIKLEEEKLESQKESKHNAALNNNAKSSNNIFDQQSANLQNKHITNSNLSLEKNNNLHKDKDISTNNTNYVPVDSRIHVYAQNMQLKPTFNADMGVGTLVGGKPNEKKDVDWNEFESDLFDFGISSGHNSGNNESLSSESNISEESKSRFKSNVGSFTLSNYQRNCAFKTESSGVKNSPSYNNNNNSDNKKEIIGLPLIKVDQFSTSKNSKVEKIPGKKLSTKLDLDSDDFWKEFE
ncbi:protein kinase [Cryptosporidium ubiquitum]|uniref:Protein kinase n=1 Tax=Cryptosporidium ubiquitum TaxID=857276 RepID=A0A1J4MHI6_9CRYT|nr:protein kinase [Cryptosporidium ubiquitum]OII73672.1 protein kinase [Cryptosporidium ubiquitum]